MKIEIGQDSIFFCFFRFFLWWLCILYISFCAISCEPAIYWSVNLLKFFQMYYSELTRCSKILDKKFEYLFFFSLSFVHCTRWIENRFFFLLLRVHWSVNCLTFLCFFSIVVLAFEYFISYPCCYTHKKCAHV